MLSAGEPFQSQCYDAQGLVVGGGQPSVMDDGFIQPYYISSESGKNIYVFVCGLTVDLTL